MLPQIPLVADLPVGEHLQDHVFVDGIEFEIDDPISITDQLVNSLKANVDYEVFKKGLYYCELIMILLIVRQMTHFGRWVVHEVRIRFYM